MENRYLLGIREIVKFKFLKLYVRPSLDIKLSSDAEVLAYYYYIVFLISFLS